MIYEFFPIIYGWSAVWLIPYLWCRIKHAHGVNYLQYTNLYEGVEINAKNYYIKLPARSEFIFRQHNRLDIS